MSTYRFIKLMPITKEESPELLSLIEKFNAYATHINTEYPNMSNQERKEYYYRIEYLNQLIKEYEH